MIGWHPLLHTGPFTQRKSIQENLQCLFSEEAEAGCCSHPYPSYPITSQEGGGVWRLEPERFSTQWLCHLVKIFRIPWALKFPFLPSPSQRVSIKVMWGNGPICALKATLKKKKMLYKRKGQWDLPGGPVVKTRSSQCRGHGFDPWSGN